MDDRTTRSQGDLIVTVVFVAMLLVPGMLALAGYARSDTAFIGSREARRPFVAPPPTSGALATGGWERDAEREIADAFPLRTQLIESYDHAKYDWLHDVGSSLVMPGRDGWLFLAADEFDELTGRFHPSDADLARVADRYAARSSWCARHGIRYVFVLAPNKSTVYPDELPPGITPVTPTPADRLYAMLAARHVASVDVRARLRDLARANPQTERGMLYSYGDTHWNDAGAYAAYRTLVEVLTSSGVHDTIRPETIDAHVVIAGGDLLRLAGVSANVGNRWLRYDFPRRARDIAPPDPPPGDPAYTTFVPTASERDDPALPSVVVFGDSFTEQLHRFLAESFRRSLFLRVPQPTDPQFDERVLLAQKPTVVIDEMVERNLVYSVRL
ncbi:MAG: hypothetical protein JOZ86_06820 [Candidatus Eremiobacteraeota bacterium]|nr:hypothetical protein [Candidatus Eremiobacteraeota bacterium]